MTESNRARRHRIRTTAKACRAARSSRARRRIGAASPASRLVHAQEKIVLRYLGTAVNQDKDDRREVQGRHRHRDPVRGRHHRRRDQARRHRAEQLRPDRHRVLLAQEDRARPATCKGIDTKRIKNADKITPLFTKGEVAGKKVGDQGTAPKKVMFLEGEKRQDVLGHADAVDDADPDRLQRRHAGHPARPDQAPDRHAGPSC